MLRHPGLALALAFSAGLWTRDRPAAGVALAAGGLAFAFALALAASGGRGLGPGGLRRRARDAARLAAFFLAGLLRAPGPSPDTPREGDLRAVPVLVEGIVDWPPIERVEDLGGVRSIATHFSLVTGAGVPVRVICEGRLRGIRGGSRARAAGRLSPDLGPRNPGDGGFPARAASLLRVPHPAGVREVEGPRRPASAWLLGSVREAALRTLELLYSERHLGFVLAMLLGDRRLLPPDIRDALLFTGTFHLLAISGLHVVLVMFLAVRIPLPRRLRLPLRLLFLAAFTAVTGASPPVVRAAAMCALQLAAERAGRKPRGLNTLGWSALLLLAIDPRLLDDAGFQLSFVSVLAILTWGARLSAGAHSLGAAGRLLLGPLLISAAASAGTAPLILHRFQRLHALGPLWNILAYPLTVVPLAGGALSLALGLVHPVLGLPAARAVELLTDALLAPLAAGAAWPGSAISLPPPPGHALGAAYAVLAAGLLPPPWRRAAVAIAAAAILAALGLAAGRGPPEIWTFDAGPGDAALLRAPGAGSWLVDAGARGSDDRAAANLTRAVLCAGERALGGAFVTHPHADHVRGLAGLLDRLPLGQVLVPPGFEEAPAGLEAARRARAAGARVRALAAGARLRFPGAPGLSIDVLHPPAALPGKTNANDASLALRVSFRGSALLLLGDLEEAGLAALFASGEDLGADVLAAPHHGRANALWPRLLERVRPRCVVISGTGDGGARELAGRLEARGIAVLATWRRGAVRTAWEEGRGWVPRYWRGE
ncbi:MAG: ComEC/Rec2 family competence protein [Planctomycetes bacterium]|nr:ComEC/Rec2 family competence protein [Planctomycetota bacterium]